MGRGGVEPSSVRRLGGGALALVMLATVTAGRAAVGDPGSQHVDCGATATPTERLLTTVTGAFTTDHEGAYVMVPFAVPDGATRVRVALSHDAVQFPNPVTRHTLDLGLYEPGDDGFWDGDEFRGWGGSSRLDVCVSPDAATLGFKPGPVPAGEWAAEIGVAAVAGPDEGDPDGTVQWRLRVLVDAAAEHADDPWQPTPYDETPAAGEPGWYAGDLHVHAEHSNPNDATMAEAFGYAFDDPAGPQLDFVTLSDYVTDRHWDEIGAFQDDHPGKLVIRSAEVITYRGHVNNHATGRRVDHRTGPVYEYRDGSLAVLRPAGWRTARDVLGDIHAANPVHRRGWGQVNHPTIFPSTVPAFGNLCRGCSWEYSDEETDWSLVDAFEVQTGPAGTPHQDGSPVETDGLLGPNPFTPAALEWFDRLQRRGFDLTAVGVSDSHQASHQELTQAPIGEGQTVVWADELSEQGVARAIRAGHAYVKFFGSHSPDLRLTGAPLAGTGPEVMMGDELVAPAARFRAQVIGTGAGPGPLTLHVFRDGVPFLHAPVPNAADGDVFDFEFVAPAPGDYRLQVMRGTAVEAITNPVNLLPPDLPDLLGGGDDGGGDDGGGDRPGRGHGGRPDDPGPPNHAGSPPRS